MRAICDEGLAFSALLIIAFAACSEPTSAPLPGHRTERITREVLREFPELERHFGRMSYDDAFRAGGDLVERGIPRLNDEDTLSFVRQRHGLLSSSDETCAALVGQGDAHAAARAVEALPEADIRAWIRLTARAQALELRGGPRPMSPEQAAVLLTEALERIRAALSAADAARWDAARSGGPDDACFLERTTARELLRMSPADAVRFHRAMAERTLTP